MVLTSSMAVVWMGMVSLKWRTISTSAKEVQPWLPWKRGIAPSTPRKASAAPSGWLDFSGLVEAARAKGMISAMVRAFLEAGAVDETGEMIGADERGPSGRRFRRGRGPPGELGRRALEQLQLIPAQGRDDGAQRAEDGGEQQDGHGSALRIVESVAAGEGLAVVDGGGGAVSSASGGALGARASVTSRPSASKGAGFAPLPRPG